MPLHERYPTRLRDVIVHRGVELVQIDDGGDVAYRGRTDQRGVGIAHFSFRHE